MVDKFFVQILPQQKRAVAEAGRMVGWARYEADVGRRSFSWNGAYVHMLSIADFHPMEAMELIRLLGETIA